MYGQCSSWLKEGLHPRAITRDLDWGVPIPVEGGEGKVMYVWFDAPIGYVTFTKQLIEANPERFQGKSWEDYWKKDGESNLIHFIGKDNIVFHCIIFPSMLKEMEDYVLPANVPANEFLNLEGEKFSTSKNWAVWLDEYLKDFPEQTDVLRYVLCSNMPEQKDADFTWQDFQNKNNNELVANLGNFVNRSVVLTNKYYDGIVPEAGNLEEVDKDALAQIKECASIIGSKIEEYRFREAQAEMMKIGFLGNKYLAEQEPWKLAKTDPERVKTIMNVSIQIVGVLAQITAPFLPQTCGKLQTMLNIDPQDWINIGKETIPAGHQINKAQLLFTKIEDQTVEEQRQKLLDAKASASDALPLEEIKEETQFDDFQKMDIRVATILSAEKVKKTKKLLKIELDTGLDKRTVVSGIAEFYKPEEIIGQQVLCLVNLAPRKLKGIESQGMILMAEDPEGTLKFVQPTGETTNGSTVA